MKVYTKITTNAESQAILANEQNDWEWLSKIFPVVVVCITLIIFGPYLLRSYGFCAGLKLSSFYKILVSILPVQLVLFVPIFYTYYLANNMVDFTNKLSTVNWKISYFIEAFFCEVLLVIPLYSFAIFVYWLALQFKIDTSAPISLLLKNITLKGVITVFLLSVFITPWIEEIIFRRIFFSYIKKLLGVTPSTLITSFVFAIVHGSIIQILPLTFLGIVLQLLYIKHKSILPAVLLHGIHNFVVMSVVLIGWSNGAI